MKTHVAEKAFVLLLSALVLGAAVASAQVQVYMAVERTPGQLIPGTCTEMDLKGWIVLGSANWTATPGTTSSSPPTVPLKTYWHGGRADNFGTATAMGENDALAAGYVFIRAEGQVFPSPQTGTVPLKLYWHGGRADNFTTATAEGERDAQAAGYQYIRIEGYVYSSQQPGTVPLKTYWHGGRGDNFTTATAEGEQSALAAGYQFIRVEGYMPPPPPATSWKPLPETIQVIKEVDVASPKLSQAFSGGELLTRVEIRFYRTNTTTGRRELYQKRILYNAKITSRAERSEPGKQVEELGFSYPRIREEAYGDGRLTSVTERDSAKQ